ncbi:MBL fold metallo-hydrolase [Pseudomonadota bacterium]
MNIIRKTFPVGPLQCNCTILGDSDSGMGYVFDPGGDAQRILAAVATMGLKIIGIIHTPGHTAGSTSFYFEDSRLLIAGDTLFQGSVGRTDLEGGSAGMLQKSIQQRLYKLDESATVITGHGPETTIGHEMRFNAFVRAR